MVVKKLSVSLERRLAAGAAAAAAAQGLSLSAWLARAVERELKLAAGQEAIAWYEAEFGAFTATELADADAYLDAVGVLGPDDA